MTSLFNVTLLLKWLFYERGSFIRVYPVSNSKAAGKTEFSKSCKLSGSWDCSVRRNETPCSFVEATNALWNLLPSTGASEILVLVYRRTRRWTSSLEFYHVTDPV
jgi:hypothetical protein